GTNGWGKLSRAGLTSRYSALPLCVTGRAEHFFEALTEFPGPDAFFGQGPQPPLGACSSAPKICSLKPWRPAHMGAMPTGLAFKAVARRLTAMPEVLPVQFKQMLCSNGVKLCFDLAVTDECNDKHKQRRANDPQSETPTSPIHCFNLLANANPRPS